MNDIKVSVISLGCSKNLVDSERMLAILEDAGMRLVYLPEEADVAVINTCAFIEDAKKEAIDVILTTAELKKTGKLKKLIVAGCMAQRYSQEILKEMPEVDAVIGAGSWSEIAEAVKRTLGGERVTLLGELTDAPLGGRRIVTTPKYTAYIKIAEGCSNNCAFCVIPKLRGPYRSRPFEDIIDEARSLAKDGVRELIVVAQDVSKYGVDLYGKRRLRDLINALDDIDGIKWVRLHYLYPDQIDDNLLETIAQSRKTLRYFDIPIQHISSRLLRTMNRHGDKILITNLLRKIREIMPDAVIRTSIIAGLPGEREQEFDELCAFLRAEKLPRVGVFTYSKEEGTPAAEIPVHLQIDKDGKIRRNEIISDIQSRIIDEYNESCRGKIFEVLVEGFDPEQGMYFGRSYADSPDIDGRVFFSSEREPEEGEFLNVRISSAQGFDLYGEEAGQ